MPLFLTKDSVKDIRALWKTRRYTQSELAKRYAVSQSCISRIVRNIRWHTT